MRLRDDSQNRQSARHQREQCAACLDTLAYETDAIGRVFAFCPHCRDGRPHSRAKYLARLAEEDAACRVADSRRCEWCDAPYTPENSGQRYCGLPCREAMTEYRDSERKRRRRKAEAAGEPVPKRIALAPRPAACGYCGKTLEHKKRGQPKQFCNEACRNRSYRGRRPESRRTATSRRFWQNKITAIQEVA